MITTNGTKKKKTEHDTRKATHCTASQLNVRGLLDIGTKNAFLLLQTHNVMCGNSPVHSFISIVSFSPQETLKT